MIQHTQEGGDITKGKGYDISVHQRLKFLSCYGALQEMILEKHRKDYGKEAGAYQQKTHLAIEWRGTGNDQCHDEKDK